MDDTTRWAFYRFIDLIRADETWEQRKCMASIRSKADDQRDYLTQLAQQAFWNDEPRLASALESISRLE